MVVYGLYIFDRHCTCTFYASFNGKPPRPGPSTLPFVYTPPTSSTVNPSTSPRDSISTTATTAADRSSTGTGIIPPWSGAQAAQAAAAGAEGAQAVAGADETKAGLAFDEEAKLVYGIVFSLRNLVSKLAASGDEDDSFQSFSTSMYKLHYLKTATSTHFVLVTSPTTASYRNVLRQIQTGPFTELVVRNPMIELDSAVSGRGIDNEAFRSAVTKMVAGLAY